MLTHVDSCIPGILRAVAFPCQVQTREQKQVIVDSCRAGDLLDFTMNGKAKRMVFIRAFAMNDKIPRSKDKKHPESGFNAREEGIFKTCYLGKITNLQVVKAGICFDSRDSCETHVALMLTHIDSC